jgi:hypothetical protein
MKYGIEYPTVVRALAKVPRLGSRVTTLHASWLNLKYELFWQLLKNPASRRRFGAQPSQLDMTARKVVDALRRDGIAFVPVTDLFEDTGVWETLAKEASDFVRNPLVREKFDCRQREMREADVHKEVEYFVRYFPSNEKPRVSIANPWLAFGLRREILDTVNAYFGMWTKLLYFDLWQSVPADPEAHAALPRWHRDPEDRRKVRVFLYFSDVDSGAMEYVPGTAMLGPLGNLWGWRGPVERPPHPDEEELARRVPPPTWIRCASPRGTLIFCDTSGIHRGTLCFSGGRVLAVWAFVTPASLHRRRFDVEWGLGAPELSDAARFAVT